MDHTNKLSLLERIKRSSHQFNEWPVERRQAVLIDVHRPSSYEYEMLSRRKTY